MKVSINITDASANDLRTLATFLESRGSNGNTMFTAQELAEQPATSVPPPAVSTGPDLRAFAAAPATPFTPPAVAPVFVTVATPTPPPPPPPPPAPVLSVASVPAAKTIELDATGLPWDGRIHSSSKAKTVDGKWRARRNISAEAIAEATAEIKEAMLAVAPVPPAPTPETPTAPGLSFPQFMRLAAVRLAAEPEYRLQILNTCNELGIASLPALSNRPDLVPEVASRLGLFP